MRFLHFDLGRIKKDSTVEITLEDNEANVMLLDNINFERYKRSMEQYHFVGGYAEKFPVVLKAPHEGNWHVVIENNGHNSQLKSTVRVLPPRLPAIK